MTKALETAQTIAKYYEAEMKVWQMISQQIVQLKNSGVHLPPDLEMALRFHDQFRHELRDSLRRFLSLPDA